MPRSESPSPSPRRRSASPSPSPRRRSASPSKNNGRSPIRPERPIVNSYDKEKRQGLGGYGDDNYTPLTGELIKAIQSLDKSECCVESCSRLGTGGGRKTMKKRKYKIQSGGAECPGLTTKEKYALYVALTIGAIGVLYFFTPGVIATFLPILESLLHALGIVKGNPIYEFILMIANMGSILFTYLKTIVGEAIYVLKDIACIIGNTLLSIASNFRSFLLGFVPSGVAVAERIIKIKREDITFKNLAINIHDALTNFISRISNVGKCVRGGLCSVYNFLMDKAVRGHVAAGEMRDDIIKNFQHALSPLKGLLPESVINYLLHFFDGLLDRICKIVVYLKNVQLDLESLPGARDEIKPHDILVKPPQHIIELLKTERDGKKLELILNTQSEHLPVAPVASLLNIEREEIKEELNKAIIDPVAAVKEILAEVAANPNPAAVERTMSRIGSVSGVNPHPMDTREEGATHDSAPEGGRRKRKTRTKKRRGSYGKHLKRRSYKRVRKY